jgi:sortase A
VTGKRILPTPPKDIQAATNTKPTLQFPWWLVLYGASLLLIAFYTVWAGRTSPNGRPQHQAKRTKNQPH